MQSQLWKGLTHFDDPKTVLEKMAVNYLQAIRRTESDLQSSACVCKS
jgi:hypothetical protein